MKHVLVLYSTVVRGTLMSARTFLRNVDCWALRRLMIPRVEGVSLFSDYSQLSDQVT